MRFLLLFSLITFANCGKSHDTYIHEAEILENKGKYIEAIKILDDAILADKNNLGAYINRGTDKSALGNYKDAILDYKEALKIDSLNPMVYLILVITTKDLVIIIARCFIITLQKTIITTCSLRIEHIK
ncbi:MAG: hypothetical protein JKY02_07660 [Flavobacteriaceae bacterium]|nr:hypothetical protein [Flavobacteriaceae bacterium]